SQAAVASLLHRGACCFKRGPNRLVISQKLSDGAPDLEKEIYEHASLRENYPIAEISKAAASSAAIREMGHRLHEVGLLVANDRQFAVRCLPFLIALLVPVAGFIKVQIGLARHRPVNYLVFGCLASGVVALLFLFWKVHRSRRGDLLLKQL